MNRSALKKYAPQARLDFIEAVTLRARRLGLDPTLQVSVEQTGDVLLIAGQPFPASVAKQRTALAQRIQRQGFSAVVEALAYTWFNRLVAIRFMELKGYLSHGYRVLSHPQGQQPEILDHVQHLDLPGLDKAEVIRLKTAGNQDEALYREILLAQCHELHRNMPFLFEALDDATELLLPDNLLRTDSPIAHLVCDIEEADWQEVEVIGWLYQFFISDKKDEVIGKVVKSEDIPAATQLFTPNWIVQYLVQNSLGRLWLMANPGSSLKEKMPYYIEPAEQTPEVQAQLDALIKVRMDEDGGTLNPESLTVLDPACGSGHILVEAYNLLRAIYEERGYRLREIPRLILQKNLYGLDIDDRAAQLAGFALLMKAREDDRRLFEDEGNPPHLNVMAIQQSAGLPDDEIAQVILNAAIRIESGDAFHSGQLFGGGQLETQHSSGLTVLDLRQLIKLFEHGKTFGSLISVPDAFKVKLGEIVDLLATVSSKGDDLSRSYAGQVLEQFALPASMLALQYDAVVANPPYMGVRGMPPVLKDYCKKNFIDSKTDLFASFVERSIAMANPSGFSALVTMHAWMFLSTFEQLRKKIMRSFSIESLIHIGARGFDSISGEVVQTVAFCLHNVELSQRKGVFLKLTDGRSESEKKDIMRALLSEGAGDRRYHVTTLDFDALPGSPIAYWATEEFRRAFRNSSGLDSEVLFRQGMSTTDAERFERLWHEISNQLFVVDRNSPFVENEPVGYWYPFNKGGSRRKWYGNFESVVRYERNGQDLLDLVRRKYPNISDPEFVIKNRKSFFLSAITYASVGTGDFSARYVPDGFAYSVAGPAIFAKGWDSRALLALLCANTTSYFLRAINPTLGFQIADVGKIPSGEAIRKKAEQDAISFSERAVELAKADWDEYENSWAYQRMSLLAQSKMTTLELSWGQWFETQEMRRAELKEVEEENNRLFILAYGLQDELSPEVSETQITMAHADREIDCQRLISYAIGCMMGRYSLDEPGLIYARSGNLGFESGCYTSFPADLDGIIPVTDEPWFEDDAAERLREFVRVVWGAETLVENMEWLADSLGRKAGESADEVIRRYQSTSFYKYHLQTYKKRPIYWLFSSGKQKAFECLVYLHRYNEGTLSRMRMEYVVPLQSRMQARIDKLTDDIDSATSSVQQRALQKRVDKLNKQLEELRRFDENLRPYADQRISLDLDDGVKVNYGKFGNLLAEVKAITGGKED